MMLYLFVQMIELLEASETGSTDMLAVKGRGKKTGSSATNLNDISSFWDVERKVNALKAIYAVLQLNLAILFEPPVVEEDLVNLVANCQFRLLESPSVCLQRSKDLRVAVLEVLGTLNQRFGYTLSCRLKIGQSLRHFEHLGTPLAEGVELFARQFGCTSLVLEVVRDISQIDETELSRDTSATRAYATFLTELASRAPDLMRPCLSLLIVHLDGDSASLRKCVLTVLGEFLISMMNVNKEEALAEEEKNRETRDQLLDYLEDHVHDVHANVRNKFVFLSRSHVSLLVKSPELHR
jgi:condensin complex subunit 1